MYPAQTGSYPHVLEENIRLATNLLPRVTFKSYEDVKQNYAVRAPNNFNFATHVVDAYAAQHPRRKALVWCNDEGAELTLNFAQMSDNSQRYAALFKNLGITKGDRVLMILKRRAEYWQCAVALHRLGAVVVPASYLLTAKDIAYRLDEADARAILCAGEDYIIEQAHSAAALCKKTPLLINEGASRPGWINLAERFAQTDGRFVIDPALTADDPMILYFTSGTTGMPKMVLQTQSYPIGHITTALYWQQCVDGGLHLTVSDFCFY